MSDNTKNLDTYHYNLQFRLIKVINTVQAKMSLLTVILMTH